MITSTEGAGRALANALTADHTNQIVMFGADWCADCRRAKTWLHRHNVPFVEFDTESDAEARDSAALVSGHTNIPVLVTPDGTVLVEPTTVELATALGRYRRRPRAVDPADCR